MEGKCLAGIIIEANVHYHSLPGFASGEKFLGQLPELAISWKRGPSYFVREYDVIGRNPSANSVQKRDVPTTGLWDIGCDCWGESTDYSRRLQIGEQDRDVYTFVPVKRMLGPWLA